jgi:hypothetical protein
MQEEMTLEESYTCEYFNEEVTSDNTVFPLRIASDPGSARGISMKRNQADTPARLTALRAAGTDSWLCHME